MSTPDRDWPETAVRAIEQSGTDCMLDWSQLHPRGQRELERLYHRARSDNNAQRIHELLFIALPAVARRHSGFMVTRGLPHDNRTGVWYVVVIEGLTTWVETTCWTCECLDYSVWRDCPHLMAAKVYCASLNDDPDGNEGRPD